MTGGIGRRMVAAVVLIVGSAGAQDAIPVGSWQGAAVREGACLPISMRFAPDGGGVLIDVPSQGILAYGAGVRAGSGRVEMRVRRFTLALEHDAEAGFLRGAMTRADIEDWRADVELVRVPDGGRPALAIEDVEFESADGVTIAGTIVRPDSPGTHPGIVFVQGRSYGSRYQHYCDAVAAARRGIAGIVFDGRGVGGSGGERGHTRQQRLDDAAAALACLRGRPEVDADRVGLFGHSAGGWVVPVVAQQAADPVAFVILHAGPVGTLAQQQGDVIVEMSRRAGSFSDDELAQARAYQERLVELATSGATWEQIQSHVATAEGQSWSERVDRPTDDASSELDYFRRNPHDNTDALRTLRVPLLGLYGGDDYVVPPADNTPRLEALMEAAGHDAFEVVVFAGADHGLMVAEDPGPPYRWARKPAGFYDTMLDWVVERVGS